MFPFTYNSSPYPCFPSSSSYHPFNFPNLESNASSSENNNTSLHDSLASVPYNDIIPTHHHHHNHSPIIIPETLTNLGAADHCGDGAYNCGISNLLTKKKPAAATKKDRHSKIYTSQGLRDRRVRLSIEIARKFFDLQDMLGFDKASNTLDWLFTKSKKAIKELARRSSSDTMLRTDSFSSSSSDCEEVVDDSNDAAKEMGKLKRAQNKEPAASCSVRAKMKESREKARARARARARTGNKMCNTTSIDEIEMVQDLKKNLFPAVENSQDLVGCDEVPRDKFNIFEESIVIKRKLKPSNLASSQLYHHQNLNVIPDYKELPSFNNTTTNTTHEYYHSFPNFSPNWDANCGATSTSLSNFYAIASINLSTGLQIFGNSREDCNNPRLH